VSLVLRFWAVGLVAATLSCISGGPNKLCGAVGQPCCASAACDEGARCGGDSLCAPCGALDQLCCADDTCTTGLTCTGRLCAASLVCPTQCTLGVSRCSGQGGIETCVANGVCPEWRTIVATCPANTSCVAGATQVDCVEKCAGACTVSALSCTAAGLQECVQGPADVCPVLKLKEENSPFPLCVAGATAEPDFGWESPTPFGAAVAGLAGTGPDELYVLDRAGNIIHNLRGTWTYEVRPTPGKELNAVATCDLPSYAFAAGKSGAVFMRRGGRWAEEDVGQNVELRDIACDSLLNAVAVGASGRLFVRRSGVWSAVESSLTGPFNAVALNESLGKAWAVGPGGQVVRCDGVTSATPTCARELVGITTELFDVTADEGTGRVFAVGAQTTVVSRGSLGTWANFPGLGTLPRVDLRAIVTTTDQPGGQPELMVAGDQGLRFTLSGSGPVVLPPPAPTVSFASLVSLPMGRWFAGDPFGALWYGVSFDDNARLLGGGKPISESLADVTSAGLGRLFAVGQAGGRYRRENATWSPDNGGLTITGRLTAVTAVSANEVYAVGARGSVYVRRSGLWSIDTMGQTMAQLQDIAFDAQRLYAVGDNGAWLEKERTGSTGWQVVNHGVTTRSLNKLALRLGAAGVADEVIAVGADCEMVSKVGGTFKRVSTSPQCNSAEDLTAALFTPAGALVVGGNDGLVLQRLNGTETFTREQFTVGPDIKVITELVYANDAVWAVLLDDGLYQRVGSTWRQYQPNISSLGMNSLTFDARDGLFAVGDSGLVIRRANPP
jgi:hypothetical protein